MRSKHEGPAKLGYLQHHPPRSEATMQKAAISKANGLHVVMFVGRCLRQFEQEGVIVSGQAQRG